MATVYGGTTNHWRAYMTYTTSQTSTTYSVPVSACGMQSVAWGFSISNGIHVVLSATNADSTSSTWDGGFSAPSGSTTSKSFGSRTFTWSRGKSAATKTVKITVTNSSGYMNGTSSKSVSVTVPALDSYAVTFNANGGSGAPSAQTKWYGEDLTLSTTKPTRTGYSFLGWSTSSSATTATWAAGGTYTANASDTLYAVWKANTYTVSYNANGGSGTVSPQTKTYGVALTLRSNSYTRTGYTFDGWNTKSDGSGTSYAAGGSYAANAAVTLYAKWKADTYAVTYYANGGSGAPSSQTKTYGVSLRLSSTVPTRTNYDFLGWATSSTATTATYAAGGTYTANAAAQLYAVWKLAYWPPRITSLSARRVDSADEDDDEGTYVHVSFSWEVCTLVTNAASSCGVSVTLSGTEQFADAIAVSGTSGQASARLSTAIDTDHLYGIVVTFEDTYGGRSTASTIISQAFFMLDFMAGGHGVGVGVPATETDTMRVGLELHALGNVVADGNVSAANIGAPSLVVDMDDLTTSGIYYISASSTNIPAANYAGQCVVANSGNSYIVQLFTLTAAAPVIYARRMNTSGWGSWARIAEERHMTYSAGQDAYVQNYAGTTHQWGISVECVNANNASYYGKRTGLIVRNDGFSLYDPSTSSTIWQLDATPTEQVVQLTNATATTFSVRKAQPMCTLYVQQLNVTSALASGANVSIGTIPSGYRPPHPITVPLNCNNNNSGKGVYLYITTAGAVSIYNRSGASMATNVNLYGCATWVL